MFDEIVETRLYAFELPFHRFTSMIASTELSNQFTSVLIQYYVAMRYKAPLLLAYWEICICWHGLCSYIPARLKSKVI
jgi:hypothetical protein